MQWTEQAIKSRLDGTFTGVRQDGSVVTAIVPLDYTPTHRPHGGGIGRGRRDSYRRWTAAEDKLLIERRKHKLSIVGVGRALGRTEEMMRHRVRLLREKGVLV